MCCKGAFSIYRVPLPFCPGDRWPSDATVTTNDEINRWCHSLHILAMVPCDSGGLLSHRFDRSEIGSALFLFYKIVPKINIKSDDPKWPKLTHAVQNKFLLGLIPACWNMLVTYSMSNSLILDVFFNLLKVIANDKNCMRKNGSIVKKKTYTYVYICISLRSEPVVTQMQQQ